MCVTVSVCAYEETLMHVVYVYVCMCVCMCADSDVYQQCSFVFIHDNDVKQSIVPQNLTEILQSNANKEICLFF